MKETEAIKSMFDRIVQRYDFLNRLLSFGQDILWRKRMAYEVSHSEKKTVLDLATGTADSAIALIQEAAKVIGADISYEMLKAGKKKIEKKGMLSNFIPVSASAYQLPFKDKSFDAVTCAFGIRNMHETKQALKEIYRVIKPGGRIVVLEFSLPKGFIRKLYLIYLKKFIPFIASIFSISSAYEYLGLSIEGFYKPEEFVRLLQSCGFNNIKSIPLSFGCVCIYVGERL